MIRVISGKELEKNKQLSQTMFRDRAIQFHDRLDWEVKVDESGQEKDEYDLPHTLYIIAVDQNGLHAGSMRLLPTTSNTMISDHFQFLIQDIEFVSPHIWECTRFCLSGTAALKNTALELFIAAAEIFKNNQLRGMVAVFDPLMERVYRRYGVNPEILGSARDKQGRIIKVGMWHDDNLVGPTLTRLAIENDIYPNIATLGCQMGDRPFQTQRKNFDWVATNEIELSEPFKSTSQY